MTVVTTLEELFRDWTITETSPNKGKDIDIVRYPCVHMDDQEPITLVAPNLQNGPWIAGGAALRWYQGQAVSENDIDVFCKSAEQMQEIVDRIKSYGRYSTKHDSDNATTLSYHDKKGNKYWTIQIIKRRYFDSLQEVIDNFDISVCQIGTAGTEWLMGSHTALDIRERNLRMNLPLHPDAAKRFAKYWTYGYRPVPGLLEAVQNNPVGVQRFEVDGDYENAF